MFPAQAYSSCVDLSTFATFRALVDAIVPRSPELAVYAPEQVYGAVDLCIHQYLIWELDHSLALVTQRGFSVVPLSAPAAIMLNEAAIQVVRSGSAAYRPNPQIWPLSPYAALAPLDRIRVLSLLEESTFQLDVLPPPFDDIFWRRAMAGFLTRHTLFGYYSEWSAYGDTRLMTPVDRRLQGFPVGWMQTGYPGVRQGYRVFMGYPLTIVRDEGGSAVVSG